MLVDEELPERDWSTLADAYRQLLAADPRPAIGTLRQDGLMDEIPDSLPIGEHQRLSGRSIADVVMPSDRPALIDAWVRSRTVGQASVDVRLTNAQQATITLIDLRGIYGTIVIGLQGTAEMPIPDFPTNDLEPVPPRYARVLRDELGRIVEESAELSRMLGMTAEDYVWVPGRELLHPEDYPRVVDVYTEVLANPAAQQRFRARYRRGDGSWLWVEATLTNELVSTGHIRSDMIDISAEMAHHESLRARERLLAQLTDAFPLGILQIAADGSVSVSNSQAARMLGVDVNSLSVIQSRVRDQDQAAFERLTTSVLAGAHGDSVEVGMELPGVPGLRYRRFDLRPLRDEDDRPLGLVASVTDITELTLMQAELRAMASLDSLTGCHNRRAILSVLDLALVHPGPAEMGTGVIFVDLDRFKPINDTFGHGHGDTVLRETAARLRSTVREHDTVGRLGGDEFLVVMPQLNDPDEALHLAQRLVDALRAPIDLGERAEQVKVGASAGVSWALNDTTDATRLIREADRAMYRAKRDSTGRPVLKLVQAN